MRTDGPGCNVSRNSLRRLVFNGRMKRFAVAIVVALILGGAAAVGLASGAEIQVGSTTTPLTMPTCPTETSIALAENLCTVVLRETTALETVSDSIAKPDMITQPGVIDSFTLAISSLSIPGVTLSSEVTALNAKYGGAPSAQLTVLRPVAAKTSAGTRWAVAAQSPVMPLTGYLGGVVEFPLIAPLPVVKGEVLAITVPTWAPILTFGLPKGAFSYEQSHVAQVSTAAGASKKPSCANDPSTTLAQLTLGQQALYDCSYPGTRVEYSALELTAPAVTSKHRHTRR
jgi:hypothetical protein